MATVHLTVISREALPPPNEGYGTGYEVEFMLGAPDDPNWIVLVVLPGQVELVRGAA